MRTDFVIDAGGDGIEPLRHTVKIALSKRNLLALLHKVDSEESARTLIKDDVFEGGSRVRLVVVAEPDDVHYRDREPGRMHPDSEAFIKQAA